MLTKVVGEGFFFIDCIELETTDIKNGMLRSYFKYFKVHRNNEKVTFCSLVSKSFRNKGFVHIWPIQTEYFL